MVFNQRALSRKPGPEFPGRRGWDAIHMTAVVVLAAAVTGELLHAQAKSRDYRGELDVSGRPNGVAISATGQVWFTTVTGIMYVADSIAGDWREAGNSVVDTTMSGVFGRPFRMGPGSIEGLTFADSRHGIAWGLIHGDHMHNRPAQVHITDDGGATWRLVEVGEAFLINDAHAWASGEIILAGYDGAVTEKLRTVLFRSTDFGRHWTSWPAPEAATPVAGISFDDASNGLLAALNNELFLTRNGGRTWQRIPTPLDQRKYVRDNTYDPFARMSSVVFAHGRLLVRQDGKTFQSRASAIDWQPWAGDELAIFDTDVETGEVCAVDVRLRALALDSAFVPRVIPAGALLAQPLALQCRAGRLVAMDTEFRLYSLDSRSFRHGFPLTSAYGVRSVETSRMHGTSLWGTTGRFLYGSPDSGRTWYRLPYTASTVAGFLPTTDKTLFVWDGHGINARFDANTEATTIVPSLAGADVVNVVPLRNHWIAYGGRQYETSFRVEVAQSFFAGEFRGTRDEGFVALSSDSGVTWREIDRWKEGGPAAIYASADASRIIMVSYLGSIRELVRRGNGYTATNLLVATPENRDAVPYVQHPFAVYFDDAKTGYISGWIHHLPNHYFRTRDGGRSWARIEEKDFPYRGIFPFDGRYVGWTSTAIHFLAGPRREPIVDLRPVIGDRSTIHGISRVGATDRLLVDFYTDATIRQVIVDTKAKTWTQLPP